MLQLTISSEDLNGKETHSDDKKTKGSEKQNTLKVFKHKSVKRLTLKRRGNSNNLIPVSITEGHVVTIPPHPRKHMFQDCLSVSLASYILTLSSLLVAIRNWI